MRNVHIEALTIGDAWFKAVYQVMMSGLDVRIDKGSFEKEQQRKELDFVTILIQKPYLDPMLPVFPEACNIPNPFSEKYAAEDYTTNYIFAQDKHETEAYTYGSRIFGCLRDCESGYRLDISQIEMIIRSLKDGDIYSNQHIIQIAERTDLLIEHPPCLRHIDIKVIDGAVCFYPYFRSWDLWSAFPINLYGIEMLKQYIATETGLENGEIMASSKGLHIYSTMWDFAGNERIIAKGKYGL